MSCIADSWQFDSRILFYYSLIFSKIFYKIIAFYCTLCLIMYYLCLIKLNKMKTKRFTTTKVKEYRLSNSTVIVSFDTIEEAKEHIKNEHDLHSRSKKVSNRIYDTVSRTFVQ